ncbi:hypothetical protein [Acidocella aromatica]|uniref:CubicO group peptidase (Beta-lactamase class C family) n=1 Tax=Acidocella aromatica TaxID=1303579 RepID=A0A840VKP6_9PROT|nr:hypothetical protein [Acidocella aromatica]MBB5372151.1 CubicO group peptidase (beta-lactamase class C family) [Acidocella aromatica]
MPSHRVAAENPALLNNIAAIAQNEIARGDIPGTVIEVGHRGRIVYRAAFGYGADSALLRPDAIAANGKGADHDPPAADPELRPAPGSSFIYSDLSLIVLAPGNVFSPAQRVGRVLRFNAAQSVDPRIFDVLRANIQK